MTHLFAIRSIDSMALCELSVHFIMLFNINFTFLIALYNYFKRVNRIVKSYSTNICVRIIIVTHNACHTCLLFNIRSVA